MSKTTVLIPVGGYYRFDWLGEAVKSVLEQTVLPDELLFIDDIHDDTYGITIGVLDTWFPDIYYSGNSYGKHIYKHDYGIQITKWNTPWPLGFSSVFNCGIGIANYDLIIFLAADDKLMPTAIEDMLQCYEDHDQKDAFYSCSYEINGEVHTIPINLGMITRSLFRWLGGYPPAAFVGPDAAMHSILMKHAPDRRIWVKNGTPLYFSRDHDNQETKLHTWNYVDEMNSIRDKLTRNFKPNESVHLR